MEKHEGFWYSVGDFFWDTFEVMQDIYNKPNYLFIGIGFVCFAWWMIWQSRFNKEAARNGTLK